MNIKMIHQLPNLQELTFPYFQKETTSKKIRTRFDGFGRPRYAVVTTFHAPGVADGHLPGPSVIS